MGLFDDGIVNVASAFDDIGKKATEVVDKSKVRVSSVELKNKIAAQFETLGRYVYDSTVTNTTDTEIVNRYIEEITGLITELKSMQDMLASSAGKIVCPKCSCTNSSDSLFCKKCGNSLDFANNYTTKAPVAAASEEDKPSSDEKACEENDPAESETTETIE